MKELMELIKSNMKQYTMIIVLICITAFFQFATGGILLLPDYGRELSRHSLYK